MLLYLEKSLRLAGSRFVVQRLLHEGTVGDTQHTLLSAAHLPAIFLGQLLPYHACGPVLADVEQVSKALQVTFCSICPWAEYKYFLSMHEDTGTPLHSQGWGGLLQAYRYVKTF